MQPQDNPSSEAMKREMYRTSLDSIRVYNPTDEDYFVDWDGHKHRVPNKNKDTGDGKGMRILPRYLAKNYVREMHIKLVNAENDQKLEDLKDKMTKAGVTDVTYNANAQFERQHDRRTDNPDLMRKNYEILWLGLEEEFGMDNPEMPQDKPMPNNTPTDEQVLAQMKNKRYVPPTETTSPVEPVQEATQKEWVPINKLRKDRMVQEVSK